MLLFEKFILKSYLHVNWHFSWAFKLGFFFFFLRGTSHEGHHFKITFLPGSLLQVVPGALAPVDLAVANILVGQLVRPSMVAALCANLKPGGLLCLSGIRPDEVPSLKKAYEGYAYALQDV